MRRVLKATGKGFLAGVTSVNSIEGWVFDGNSYLGDWKKTPSGALEVDLNGKNGFSAIVDFDSGTVVVEHSSWLAWCHNTSPCYKMIDGRYCGDLDTSGVYGMAYSLPPDFYREGVNE